MSDLARGSTRLASAVLLALALPTAASAQLLERGEIRAYGGVYLPQEASALDAGPLAGVRAGYQILPWLDLAVNASGTRMTTQENFFRPAALRFVDQIELWDPRQDVVLVHYGAEFGLSTELGALRPYASVGGGGYTLFLDAQVNQEPRRNTGPQFTGAIGASYQISGRSGINLEIRDHILFDYDREQLNPVDPAIQDDVFPEIWPDPPEAKDSIHGLTLSVGFTYIP